MTTTSKAKTRLMAASMLVMIFSNAAIAGTTSLICMCDQQIAEPKMNIELDETHGTVTLNYPADTYMGVSTEASSDTFPAVFGAKEVTFSKAVNGMYSAWTIDRLTATATVHSGTGAPYDSASPENRLLLTYSCHVAHAQF